MTIPHVHSQASAAQRPHGYGLGNLEARLARVGTREPGKARLIGDNWSRMPHSWSYPPLGSLEHPEFLSSWVLSFFFLASRLTQPVQWTVWGIAMTTSTLGVQQCNRYGPSHQTPNSQSGFSFQVIGPCGLPLGCCSRCHWCRTTLEGWQKVPRLRSFF